MKSDIDRIVFLIRKFKMHTLQEEEVSELRKWLKDGTYLPLFQRLIDPKQEVTILKELQSYDTAAAYRSFMRRIGLRQRRLGYFLRIAALFVLPLIAGILLYEWGNQLPEMKSTENKPEEISSFGRKAILTLTDGRQIEIGKAVNTKMISDADASMKLDSAGLVYEQKTGSEVLKMSEVYVPQGGEFSLVLSDGTLVYLNSETRLRYPVSFGKGRREVELEGEAYFEVAPDKEHPFCVNTAHLGIQVLGTGFNVLAYQNTDCSEVTLAHGAVMVREEGKELILKPDEQLVFDKKSDSLFIRQIDARKVCAWKSGVLYFEGMPLEELAVKLSRWFDVQFFFSAEKLKQLKFTGAFRKYNRIDYVLSLIEATTDIEMKLKDRTIVVGYKVK